MHKHNFEKVYDLNDQFTLIQNCTNEIDSVVKGELTFKKAYVKDFKCEMRLNVKNERVISCLVLTYTLKDSQALYSYLQIKKGLEFSFEEVKSDSVYMWTSVRDSDIISHTFLFEKGKKHMIYTAKFCKQGIDSSEGLW